MPRRASDASHNRASTTVHEAVMQRAIALAASHHPHPNPRVGAVLVDADGAVVAEGAHRRPGEPHAEPLAIGAAGPRARGATLYVTLEPCAHRGRTPPCTTAIVDAGIERVVFGAADPDELVDGRGLEALCAAGIDVVTGILAAEVEATDPGYFHHRRTGRPLITLKVAATLDGQVAAADGTSRWITGEEARTDAHRLRAASDAVVVGAGTLRIDDPLLDVRLPGYTGPQPRPVVVAGRRPLPLSRRVYSREPIVYRLDAADVPGDIEAADVPDLATMVKDLGARQFLDVLVEGGPTLARSLLDEGLVDRLVMYLAPALAGGIGTPMFSGAFATLTDATRLVIDDVARVGGDLRIAARPSGRT